MLVGERKVALGIPGGPTGDQTAPEQMKAGIPLGRLGTSEEAANAILMLCSPYATYVSGQCLEVTGGSYL